MTIKIIIVPPSFARQDMEREFKETDMVPDMDYIFVSSPAEVLQHLKAGECQVLVTGLIFGDKSTTDSHTLHYKAVNPSLKVWWYTSSRMETNSLYDMWVRKGLVVGRTCILLIAELRAFLAANPRNRLMT